MFSLISRVCGGLARVRRQLVAVAALLSLLFAGAGASQGLAQTVVTLPGRPAGVETGIDPKLLLRLQDETAALRELPGPVGVPVHVVTPAELVRYFRERAAEVPVEETDVPAVRDTAEWKLLVLLGLVRPEFDPATLTLEAAATQVAGLYMPAEKAMLIVLRRANTFSLNDQATFVHEYTHAIQDATYDLATYFKTHGATDERAVAVRALIEGDATLVTLLWQMERQGVNPRTQPRALRDVIAAFLEAVEGEEDADEDDYPPRYPRFLTRQAYFSYGAGVRFVAEAFLRSGSFAGVEQVYANPPRSAEQILHPEKYWAGEEPVPVTLPDIAGALGSEWRLGGTGELGELDLEMVMDEHASRIASRTAAAGWGGGQWALLEQGSRAAVVLRTTWDSEQDAREFYEVYAHCLSTRWPEAVPLAATPTRQALDDPARATEMRLRGREVQVVLSFDRASADAIFQASGF